MAEFTDLTFKQLIDEHYKYQQDKVKSTTLYNYRNMMPYLEPLFNIKVESFNIRHFELWRQYMNKKKISTRYKNDVYKYLKAVMNFETKWYDLNFIKVYNKITNFTNPNERKKYLSILLKNFKSSYLLKIMSNLYVHFRHYSIVDLEMVNLED